MFNDEIDDFMSAIDHCYKMRNKHADEESNKKYTDVFNIYKPMDSAQVSGLDKAQREEYYKMEEDYNEREKRMYQPFSNMNKVSIKSKKEQIKALHNMCLETEDNIDKNFVEIIDIKTDLEEVEQFIKANQVL